MLSVNLLREFCVRAEGRVVTGLESARTRSLPDSTHAQARTNLRRELHALRAALPDADLGSPRGLSP